MEMEMIKMRREGNLLFIGESPLLIVNINSQENYLVFNGKRHIYRREVALSRDLLEGKRNNVLKTAVNYYYAQACRIAEGLKIAEEYRGRANRTRM